MKVAGVKKFLAVSIFCLNTSYSSNSLKFEHCGWTGEFPLSPSLCSLHLTHRLAATLLNGNCLIHALLAEYRTFAARLQAEVIQRWKICSCYDRTVNQDRETSLASMATVPIPVHSHPNMPTY